MTNVIFSLPRYNCSIAKNALRTRYEEPKQQIHSHNYRYQVLDAPVISDLEFDRLLNELKQIEADDFYNKRVTGIGNGFPSPNS